MNVQGRELELSDETKDYRDDFDKVVSELGIENVKLERVLSDDRFDWDTNLFFVVTAKDDEPMGTLDAIETKMQRETFNNIFVCLEQQVSIAYDIQVEELQ